MPKETVQIKWRIYPPRSSDGQGISIYISTDDRVKIFGSKEVGFKTSFSFANPNGSINWIMCKSKYASLEGAVQSVQEEYHKILIPINKGAENADRRIQTD